MGSGDLNMKKSWHPALLVNQRRVWEAEKAHSEEKKKLQQLRKEREEERQLAELQRMQEASTGKKRVEKLDWMYAAPNADSNAMGGRMTEHELEQYLLGKKRVDEVLGAGDKNVGNLHKDFIAVQNANTARDTAAKVREDPMLAMKKAEQAQLAALMNRPDIRRQLKAMKKGSEDKESREEKEERRAKRRAEKEERRRERHDRRHRHDSRSPRSDGDRRDRRDRDRDHDRDRDYDRDDRRRDRDSRDRRDRDDDRERRRDRSVSPRRDRSVSPRRNRSVSPRRDRDDRGSRRDDRDRDDRHRDDRRDRDEDVRSSSGSGSGRSRDRDERDRRNEPRKDYGNGDRRDHRRDDRPRRPSPDRRPYQASRPAPPPPAKGNALDEQRAARLAAMTATADAMQAERREKLARRAEEDRKVLEAEEKARSRVHKEEVTGLFTRHQEQMGGHIGLAESLQRRGGQGLLRDI